MQTSDLNETDCNYIIPKYVNVYNVECSADYTECWCDPSCNKISRTGIPCVHVLRVFNICNPQMFHPRYYKIYNDDVSNVDIDIKLALDEMITWKRSNPRKCCIEGLLLDKTQDYDIEKKNHQEIVTVVAAVQMDIDNKVLLKGETIPDEYISKAEDILNDTCQTNIEEAIDFDCSGNDSNFSCNDQSLIESEEPHLQKNEMANNTYSYAKLMEFWDVYRKEMDKVLRGDPLSWGIVVSEWRETLARQTQRLNDTCQKKDSSLHRLVSSNGPIERSPNGKRYKSYYEQRK